MPLLSKAGSILRQSANKQIGSESSAFKLFIHQAKRCTSSMACSEELHGRQVGVNSATDRPCSNFGRGVGGHTEGVAGYIAQYGLGVGYGLRHYGGIAGDKIISADGINKYAAGGFGSAHNFGGVGQKNSFSTAGYEISYTSSGNNASTTKESGGLPNTLRPLSPHLPVYKPQSNATFSILDRISASYLTATIFVYYLVGLKMGPLCLTNEYFYKFLFYSSDVIPLSLELSALALTYHTYRGFRHLREDYSFGKKVLK